MKKTKLLLVMAILTSISCSASKYFWVGGSGNWSDFSNHWATTSGGNIFHNQVPQSTDNVFFDVNSLSTSGQTVTIDQTIVQCADMTWTGLPTTTPTLAGDSSQTLRIHGSLVLLTGMAFNFNGQLIMEATTTGKTLSSGGTTINTSLTFNGAGGGWTLMDALKVTRAISLNNGTLNTNNQTVNASAFYSTSASVRSLVMGASIFNLKGDINGIWNINPLGMTLNAGTSTINGTSTIGSDGSFYGGGLSYNNLSFANAAFLYGNNTFHDVAFISTGYINGNNHFHDVSFFVHAFINGNNTFNNVTMGGNGTISSSNTFNNLSFSPWFTYTLQSGQTQTVGNICAQGTGALPIRIQASSAGTPAIISKASGTICWDYVRVSDITATGGAVFNAGLAPTNSQDLGGNTGLLFTGGCTAVSCLSTCTPPSITLNPLPSTVCGGSTASFTIAATGTDLSYQWQVNPGAGFTNLTNNSLYSGVTTNTLNITGATTVLNGYQYRCAAVGVCPLVGMSEAATLSVKPSPIVTVNSAAICAGQTAVLTASISSDLMGNVMTGTETYAWSTGATTSSISVSPAISTNYTVIVTRDACSTKAIATVTVNPPPSITVNSATICAGQTAVLTASIAAVFIPVPPAPGSAPAPTTTTFTLTGTTTGITTPPPPSPTTYTWSTGATTSSISVSPLATTSYTVTVTTTGCSNTAIATVTVNPVPIVSASVSSTTVTVSATGGTPPYTGTGIFTDLAPGTYSYTVTDANGCNANTNVTVSEQSASALATQSLFVCSSGTLLSTGDNTWGELGNGNTTNLSTPSTVGGITGIIAASAGSRYSLALASNGTVWSWGYNYYGSLGNSSTTDNYTPVQVSPVIGFANIIAIAAGAQHSLALKNDGTVWVWGRNDHGQLGDGTTIQRNSPVMVNTLTGIVAISAGSLFSLALKSDGTVWAWGLNNYGQLGDGTTVEKHIPIQVPGLTGIIKAISAGDEFSLIANNNTVYASGYNYSGQLGNNTTANSLTFIPIVFPGGLSGVTALAAGADHSLALRNNGTVWAWGWNGVGQLGDNTIIDKHTPIQVHGVGNTGLLTGVTSITAGYWHSIAIKCNGTALAWGGNYYGQLGDGTTINRHTSVLVNTGCTLLTSFNLIINPVTPQTICTGNSTSISLTSNPVGATFSWTVSQSGVSGATSGTGSTINQTLLTTGTTAGTATYTITPNLGDCQGTPITVTVTVTPKPIATATPIAQTICSGAAITSIAITSNVAGTTFSWVRDNTNNLTGIAPGGTGSSISGTLINTSNIQQVTTFTITGTANGCTGTTTVTVTVNPRPTVGIANSSVLTICSGTSTSILFGTSVLNTALTWTVSQSGVSGATAGYGSAIAQILTTTGPAAGTATYTVTPTANGCAGNPIPVVVTVKPKPVATATPSSQTICSGNTTGIALSSPVSGTAFNWTVTQSGVTGALAGSGSNIVQTLTTTGTTAGTATYTITPTANGCPGAPITVTVTVQKLPTVTVNSASICAGQGATLTASGVGNISYLWSTGATTNPITVTPTTTTTYTVTGTSNGTGNGCSKIAIATVSVTVCPPECNIPLDYDIAPGNTVTTAFPGLTSITDKTVRITGTLIIDHNFDFIVCRIIMTPDPNMTPAKIIVKSGATLTIAGSAHQPGTHIYGCPIMWSGIEVLNGGSVVVKQGSCIEDAISAVKIKQGATGNIINTVFNRNLTGIELTSNTSNTSPVTVQNTIFTSRNTIFSPIVFTNYTSSTFFNSLITYTPANLKAPYMDIKGLYGINASGVKTLNVGVTNAASSFNGFDAIMCGINLTNTTAKIYNNKFQYLLSSPVPATCPGCPPSSPTEKGYGVKATGTATGVYAIDAGGLNANQANSFMNTYIAIFVSKYKTNNIKGNSITNTRTGPFTFSAINYGYIGVYVSNPANNNIINISNQPLIKNCETGIWVNRSSNTALHTITFKINNNYDPSGDNTLPGITADPPSPNCPNCHCTNGIYVSDLLNGTATQLSTWEIKTNTITEAANGIFLQYVKKPNNGPLHNVTDNICGVRYSASGNTNGIIAKGCKGISLTLNHTKCNSQAAAVFPTGNIKTYGIYLQNSTNMLVKCNKMDDAARSMVFEGTCTSVLATNTNPTIGITQNTMNRAQDGFVLLNTGIIGTQGSAAVASNNYWASVFSRSQTFTQTTTGANTNSKLFMNSGTSTFPTNNQTNILGNQYKSAGFSPGLNISTGITTSCAAVRALIVSNDSLNIASTAAYSDELTTMEEDTTQLQVYSDESHWMRKHFVYDELKNDPSLNSNNSLQNFYNSSNHNYAKFAKVEDKIEVGQYNAANSINNSIVTNNIIESNQQNLNALILQDLITPGYLYTASDTAILTEIANQCPLAGGYAVYQARNLLMTFADNVIEFADNCLEESDRSMLLDPQSGVVTEYKLYPNPNDGNMIFEYSLSEKSSGIFMLYDVTGRVVTKYKLTEGQNNFLNISESGLKSGVYSYTVIIDNKIKVNNKIVILK